MQHLHEAGFAHPSLPTQHHNLPHPCLALGPALAQQPDLMLPPHKWCETSRKAYVEATLGLTLLTDLVHCQRLRSIVGDMDAQRSTDKIALDELQGRRADYNRVRCGEAGQLGRYVGCVPQSWRYAPVTTAKGADHRYARVNPHLHGEFHTVLLLELLRQPRHAPHDL